MDTDDFSDMAYGLIVRATAVSDTLKMEIGVMSRDYNNENDWLRAVSDHCREILDYVEEYVDFWNLEEEEGATTAGICELANQLICQVDIVLSTPPGERSLQPPAG